MNKMNLPCPFEDSFPLQQNEVFNLFILYILQNSVYEDELAEKEQSSEEGSELESSENEDNRTVLSKLPRKRPASCKKTLRKKIFKAKTVSTKLEFSTKSVPKTSVDEVFEKVDFEPTKKIEVKIPSEISMTEGSPIVEEAGGFGVIVPPAKSDESQPPKEQDDKSMEKCISSEELARNCLKERGK